MIRVAVARNAMATRFEIVLFGKNATSLRAAGEEALNEIERLEAQLSLYRPSSEIANINAHAAREAVRVEPSLFLKKHLAASGLTFFPKSGHVLNLEEPALFNDTLQRFLVQAEAGRWGPRDPRSVRAEKK